MCIPITSFTCSLTNSSKGNPLESNIYPAAKIPISNWQGPTSIASKHSKTFEVSNSLNSFPSASLTFLCNCIISITESVIKGAP